VATRQQDGPGAVVTVALRGGRPAVAAFLRGLECFSLAESLGGVESLVSHPCTMTHAAMPPAARERAGIGEGLLRLSVGIEAATDLVDDVERALDRAARVGRADRDEVQAVAAVAR
jgi:cystathionine gamma-synthase